jgi:signal transduction histidine kinase
MTLTQQFLIISILPFSFLGMVVYVWRYEVPRRQVLVRWTLTLIAAAIWTSNVLRFYGGVTFSSSLVFTWGIVGSYGFGMTALGILLTTLVHLNIPHSQGRIAVGLSIFLWLASLGLDPSIWPYQIPDFTLARQAIRHFDLWASVWIASWLMPIISAWILAQQTKAKYPISLYRNQVHYWLLVLTLFITGGVLASIRQTDQPVWQEVSVLFIILAAFSGSVSIVRSQLTDLQLAVRQVLSRLSGTLILFGLTWAALSFTVQAITNRPTDTDPNLLLTLAAALFAGLFIITYRIVNAITQRLFLPSPARRETAMTSYTNAVGNLPEPAQIGQLFLRIIQSSLSVDDAWIFVAEDGIGGRLVLRPLASLDTQPPDSVDFDSNSPFVSHLRKNASPLVQYDIDVLSAFDDLSETERAMLTEWQRVIFTPLSAGDRLVGVLAQGAKHTGESYDRRDLELLKSLAEQISPLLAQAQNLASLHRINDYLFQQNQELARKNTHLSELSHLHARFSGLISPDLRQPFSAIGAKLHELQENLADDEAHQQFVADLQQHINDLKASIDHLINSSAHIQQRDAFNFRPVRLDEIIQRVIRSLSTMAEARQVQVEFEPDSSVPHVLGDEQQLKEAVQHLLHNAIKFSNIGGVIQLDYALADGDVCLHVIDGGVGIPEEHLDSIWSGLAEARDDGSQRNGLGLALTQFIIAAHGGYVKAQSEPDSGSMFSIYLPMLLED